MQLSNVRGELMSFASDLASQPFNGTVQIRLFNITAGGLGGWSRCDAYVARVGATRFDRPHIKTSLRSSYAWPITWEVGRP
jgi:hypothetical protein